MDTSRLRRAALRPARPLVGFFDRRFQYLEDRFPALERRIAADVDSTAEFQALVHRAVERVEQRLEAIDARLAAIESRLKG